MFKEYFSHDYNTRSDWKIQRLIANHGMAGYGIFWAIVEDLYINHNRLPNDIETLSYGYRIDPEILNSIITRFDLFQIKDGFISCQSIGKRLSTREEKSEKAKANAMKRWSNSNANAMQKHSNGIAIKEKNIKEKEIKEKEIKNDYKSWSIDDFKNEIKNIYVQNKYPISKDEYVNFLNYWSEENSTGKMRFTMEKTWDTEKRISRWANNNQQPIKKNGNQMMDALTKTYQNILSDEY